VLHLAASRTIYYICRIKDRGQKRSFVLTEFGHAADVRSLATLYTEGIKQKEMKMKTRLTTLFVLLIAASLVTACGSASADAPQGKAESVLSQEEASALIDNALQALNNGDYAAWSRDWADDMKAAIKDPDFQEYRQQVVSQYGQYLALESIEIQPGLNADRVRWVAVADFEKGKIKYTFSFLPDGKQVKGIFPEAVE
jgi:hypothetical protein